MTLFDTIGLFLAAIAALAWLGVVLGHIFLWYRVPSLPEIWRLAEALPEICPDDPAGAALRGEIFAHHRGNLLEQLMWRMVRLYMEMRREGTYRR